MCVDVGIHQPSMMVLLITTAMPINTLGWTAFGHNNTQLTTNNNKIRKAAFAWRRRKNALTFTFSPLLSFDFPFCVRNASGWHRTVCSTTACRTYTILAVIVIRYTFAFFRAIPRESHYTAPRQNIISTRASKMLNCVAVVASTRFGWRRQCSEDDGAFWYSQLNWAYAF